MSYVIKYIKDIVWTFHKHLTSKLSLIEYQRNKQLIQMRLECGLDPPD